MDGKRRIDGSILNMISYWRVEERLVDYFMWWCWWRAPRNDPVYHGGTDVRTARSNFGNKRGYVIVDGLHFISFHLHCIVGKWQTSNTYILKPYNNLKPFESKSCGGKWRAVINGERHNYNNITPLIYPLGLGIWRNRMLEAFLNTSWRRNDAVIVMAGQDYNNIEWHYY